MMECPWNCGLSDAFAADKETDVVAENDPTEKKLRVLFPAAAAAAASDGQRNAATDTAGGRRQRLSSATNNSGRD